MRLALQATFMTVDSSSDESRIRRERIERELRGDERSVKFFRRLRAAMAQKSLKAPEVFAEESFPDANIVAEYLDGADRSEEIAEEYEKVCWSAPEILAEAGACFDLLTNSLNQTFEPPKNYRRRLYYIAWEDAARSNASSRSADDTRNIENSRLRVSCEATVLKKTSDAPRTRSSENEIAKTLRTEKKAKRRSRIWVAAALLFASLTGASYSGLIDWRDIGEQTVDFKKASTSNLDETNAVAFQNTTNVPINEEGEEGALSEPLLSLPISSSEFGAVTPLESEETKLLDEDKALLSSVSPLGETTQYEQEEYDEYPSAAPIESPRLVANASESDLKSGLESSNFKRRPSFVIPAKNNDVFSSTVRY